MVGSDLLKMCVCAFFFFTDDGVCKSTSGLKVREAEQSRSKGEADRCLCRVLPFPGSLSNARRRKKERKKKGITNSLGMKGGRVTQDNEKVVALRKGRVTP